MATIAAAPVSTAPAQTARIRLDSIDFLRGLVMILMALDHVRDYYSNFGIDPMDVARTWPALYLTRWITHFCAPVFMFLAGTGAYLYGSRRTKSELSRFLWTRGLWLVLLELTIVRFAWGFNWERSPIYAIVIWAIGWSMVLLAGAIYLPLRAIAGIGIGIVVLHNAFDWVQPGMLGGAGGVIWTVLMGVGAIPLGGGVVFFVAYAILPWFGVMAAGYACGHIFTLPPERRRALLKRIGLAVIAAFIVVRAVNIYGDPVRWAAQNTPLRTMMSFLNCNKYPPSLDYVLMTLGPALLLLAYLPDMIGAVGKVVVVFGRVPMFYYLLHIPLIHAGAAFLAVRQFGHAPWMFNGLPNTFPGTETPPGWGFSLPVVYLVWITVLVVLYPLCAWFAKVKQRRRDVWLSYL